MRCFALIALASALKLTAVQRWTKRTSQNPEGFFTEDPQAMADLNQGNTATAENCHPKCTWKCQSTSCEEACEPLCAPPKCSTSCSAFSVEKCSQTCDKPSCAVVCPENHCEMGECPSCKTVCSPATNCLTTCPAGECSSVCADPECQWKCKPRDDCPAPTCRMTCEQPKDCFHQAGGKTVPVVPDTIIVSHGMASLNIADLGAGGANGTNGTALVAAPPSLRHLGPAKK